MYAKYVSEPPSDLSPGLVGALIDEKVDTKEVMATVIDLASRGYLDIAEGGTGAKAAKSGTTFTRSQSLSMICRASRRPWPCHCSTAAIPIRLRRPN